MTQPYRLLVSSEPDGEQFLSPELYTVQSERNYRYALALGRSPLLYAINVIPKQAPALTGKHGTDGAA